MLAPRQVTAILVLLVALKFTWSRNERKLRQFNAGYDPSYSGGRDRASLMQTARLTECTEQPQMDNARIKCSFSGCRVWCDRGYKLATGRRSMVIPCDHASGTLTFNNSPWQPINTPCYPQCDNGGCLNRGVCVAPGQCRCAPGYTGDRCQDAPMQGDQPPAYTCPEPQLAVKNAQIERQGDQIVIKCNPGHAFNLGGTSATIQCRAGEWNIPPVAFLPGGPMVCEPKCDPPCSNQGICVTEELMCDCPPGYRGPECHLQQCEFPRYEFAHSRMGGNLKRLKIQCHAGYHTAIGRTWQPILCFNQTWIVPGYGPLERNDVKCYPDDVVTA